MLSFTSIVDRENQIKLFFILLCYKICVCDLRSGPIIVAPLVERSKSSFSVSREMSTLNFLQFNSTIQLFGIRNLDKAASLVNKDFGFGKTFKLFANEELPRRPLGMKDMTPCHWSNFPPRFTIDFSDTFTTFSLNISLLDFWSSHLVSRH